MINQVYDLQNQQLWHVITLNFPLPPMTSSSQLPRNDVNYVHFLQEYSFPANEHALLYTSFPERK